MVEALRSVAPALKPTYVHPEADERFSLEPVVEDLAHSIDQPTARFALRRLEFRSETPDSREARWRGAPCRWHLASPRGVRSLPSLLALPGPAMVCAQDVESAFPSRGFGDRQCGGRDGCSERHWFRGC